MHNIVVIGGGFAGTSLVKQLERELPVNWQPVLISEENCITYTPLLPEVVGGSLLPGHAVAPIRKMLGRSQYLRGRVEAVDLQQRRIDYVAGRHHSLHYDELVFACGKVPNVELIEGTAQHSLPLKTLGDALYIRNRIIVSLEQAEQEDDPEVRRRLTTFIILGGGSSGVEVAGSIADFFNEALKYYPRLRDTESKVIVLEMAQRLVSEFPPSLGEAASRLMQQNGIDIRLQTSAVRVNDEGVETSQGEWIESNNVICTIGTSPHPLLQALGIVGDRGLVTTNADMSVVDSEGVWAIGDCAAVVNAHDNTLSPPTAQFAARQGKQLARNLLRRIHGKPTRAFRYHSRGHLASIGHRRAIAHVLGVRLSGFPAWLLWRAVYLFMLPTLMRKLQVFSEWNLELLFPRDMTQLHLHTSAPSMDAEQDQDPQAQFVERRSAASR